MTIFEKKRFIIRLINLYFPGVAIKFGDLGPSWYGQLRFSGGYCAIDGETRKPYEFGFDDTYLLEVSDQATKDLVLHEIAHGLTPRLKDAHGKRFLKKFYEIGGNLPYNEIGRFWRRG